MLDVFEVLLSLKHLFEFNGSMTRNKIFGFIEDKGIFPSMFCNKLLLQ